MQTGMKVHEAMSTKPITTLPTSSVMACARKLRDHHVGSLLISENHRVKGILTEQDIVYKQVAPNLSPVQLQAKDIMTSPIHTISPDKDLYDAIVLMKNLEIRHLPVVDNHKIVGYLTVKDILRIEPTLLDVLDEGRELGLLLNNEG